MDNLFFTNSIMIRQTLPYMLKDSPAYFHDNDEAIKKMHSFCHELYKIPITWLVDHASMLKYADLLKEYIEKYNDEVAILEWGIATKDIIGDDAKEYQSWVESAEIKRPDKFQIRDEMSYFLAFCDMSDEDIDKAIKFFAEDFRRVFGRNMSTFANAFIDERTVKACKKYGIKNIWGYNWKPLD